MVHLFALSARSTSKHYGHSPPCDKTACGDGAAAPDLSKHGSPPSPNGNDVPMSGSDEHSGRVVNYARGQGGRFGRAQANAARMAAEALRIAQAAAAAADALQGLRLDGALQEARPGDDGY